MKTAPRESNWAPQRKEIVTYYNPVPPPPRKNVCPFVLLSRLFKGGQFPKLLTWWLTGKYMTKAREKDDYIESYHEQCHKKNCQFRARE